LLPHNAAHDDLSLSLFSCITAAEWSCEKHNTHFGKEGAVLLDTIQAFAPINGMTSKINTQGEGVVSLPFYKKNNFVLSVNQLCDGTVIGMRGNYV